LACASRLLPRLRGAGAKLIEVRADELAMPFFTLPPTKTVSTLLMSMPSTIA